MNENILVSREMRELFSEFHRGIVDGRREIIEDAPTFVNKLRIKNADYEALREPTEVAVLPLPALGSTPIYEKGGSGREKVNILIPYIAAKIAKIYNKGLDWAKRFVYNRAKLTVQHEKVHRLTANVAKGEEFNQKTVDVMESLATYGMHKVAKHLGKEEKAKLIEETNPYPWAWRIGRIADWAYQSDRTGLTGYGAFIDDAQVEPFYKPLWKLTKATTKKSVGRIRDYFRGTDIPSYAMTRI